MNEPQTVLTTDHALLEWAIRGAYQRGYRDGAQLSYAEPVEVPAWLLPGLLEAVEGTP